MPTVSEIMYASGSFTAGDAFIVVLVFLVVCAVMGAILSFVGQGDMLDGLGEILARLVFVIVCGVLLGVAALGISFVIYGIKDDSGWAVLFGLFILVFDGTLVSAIKSEVGL